MERHPIMVQTVAGSALNLCSQIAPLEAQLEAVQQQLRKAAKGETLALPGKVYVRVKRGTLGKTTDSPVVDELLFTRLDEKLQTMLQQRGLIRTERKVTSPRSASVEIKPNG